MDLEELISAQNSQVSPSAFHMHVDNDQASAPEQVSQQTSTRTAQRILNRDLLGRAGFFDDSYKMEMPIRQKELAETLTRQGRNRLDRILPSDNPAAQQQLIRNANDPRPPHNDSSDFVLDPNIIPGFELWDQTSLFNQVWSTPEGGGDDNWQSFDVNSINVTSNNQQHDNGG